MAPPPDSVYFPSLDKILDGKQFLISWKTAFDALLHSSKPEFVIPSSLEHFFSDPKVLELLAHPLQAFPPPSQQSKSAFEAKTSAINVTPSAHTRYDIKEVKEDVFWLTSQANIDEVVALRIVLVECQARSGARLLGRLSIEEIRSIQEAAGVGQPAMALLSESDNPQQDFNSQRNRRLRILKTYLSERRNVLECLNIVLGTFYPRLSDLESSKGKGTKAMESWTEAIGGGLLSFIGNTDQWLVDALSVMDVNVRCLEQGSGWFEDDESGREDIEMAWLHNQLMELSYSLQIMFQFVDLRDRAASSTVALAWLKFVEGFQYFDQYPFEDPIAESMFLPVKAAVTLVSLAVINPGYCVNYVGEGSPASPESLKLAPFIQDLNSINRVHEYVMRAVDFTNSVPMVLAWAAILQQMKSRVAETTDLDSLPQLHAEASPDAYEGIVRRVLEASTEDNCNVLRFLALSAVDHGQVYQQLTDLSLRLGGTPNSFFSPLVGSRMRIAILNLISSSSLLVGYSAEVVEASLAASHGGQNYWDLVDSPKLHHSNDALASLLKDEDLLMEAQQRFPYENVYLKMTQALSTCFTCIDAPSVLDHITKVESFTAIVSDRFGGYTTSHEEENNNSIRLTTPLLLFEDKASRIVSSSPLTRLDPAYIIPSGTDGRLILEANPKVAFWKHTYDGMQYLGMVLETFVTASDLVDATTGGAADRETVVDIIGTFAGLLLGASKASMSGFDANAAQNMLLENASLNLGPERDVVTVIFDIFVEELQLQSTTHGSGVSLGVISSCVHFIHAILPIYPHRVWPLVERSGLLEFGRGGGRLSTLVGNVELISGRFDLLLTCTRLFEALVDDFIINSVQRLSEPRSSARFNSADDVGRAIPHKVISNTILSFTRYFVDVLESSCTWKFAEYNDRRQLGKTLITTFDQILRSAYGIGSQLTSDEGSKPPRILFRSTLHKQFEAYESNDTTTSLLAALVPAAEHIVDSFLSPSSGNLRFQPLLVAFNDGFSLSPSTTFVNSWGLCVGQVKAALSFSTTLLRAGTLLARPQSRLEHQLFKASPLVTRLYAVDEGYRLQVVALFEALITSSSAKAGEPPSLLGHLGAQTSKNFLHVLSDLDQPLCRQECIVSVWQFLTAVLSNRQQWFANYLLTGKSPKHTFKSSISTATSTTLEKPILSVAFDALSNIQHLPKPQALAILNFVALAQNFWPWATYNSTMHPKFIKSISEFVGKLIPLQPSTNTDVLVDGCFQTKIAAIIAEVLVMFLFHSRRTGQKLSTKGFLDKNLSYFTRFAVVKSSYDPSFHGPLKRNFQAQFPGCSLLDFERTTLEQCSPGPEYFYNLTLMDKALAYNNTWRRQDGLRPEVIIANVNLSLVDAQISLLHSWSFLAIELSLDLSAHSGLEKDLFKVSMDCLASNRHSQGQQDIFQRLNQRRAELALVLVQRLIESSADQTDMKGLLPNVWETIKGGNTSFERALASGDVEYYRTLLRLLFLALRIHASSDDQINLDLKASTRLKDAESVIPIAIELLERVVAIGIRDLATFIHDKPAQADPEDVALVTGILQACLRIPGIEFCHIQIVQIFSANDTARVAATLYSWSDKFAIEGDPVYGELSMLFLLELSTMPSMAEQLAIEGILGGIASANITAYIRGGNVSPFADSAGIQRCYSIWVRGILPLLLNLLHAVGDPVGTEVALFLNQFPNLLKNSSEAFESSETSRTAPRGSVKHLCFSVCSEVHSIALITFILDAFRKTGIEIPDVPWDAANVVETVEYWITNQNVLADRIIPMGAKDMALRKQASSGFSNKLEQRIHGELLGIKDVLTEEGA